MLQSVAPQSDNKHHVHLLLLVLSQAVLIFAETEKHGQVGNYIVDETIIITLLQHGTGVPFVFANSNHMLLSAHTTCSGIHDNQYPVTKILH